MNITDINGNELARGDFVVVTPAMDVLDPQRTRKLGVGQVQHLFFDGPRKGIHVSFDGELIVGSGGLCFEKKSLSEAETLESLREEKGP